MEEEVKEKVFIPTTPIEEFELIIAEPFTRKYYFTYTSGGDTVIAKLSGNKKTTGVEADSVVHEPDGTYSVRIFGIPREINKNELVLTLKDNRGNVEKFEIVFHVLPLKIEPANLPDAVGLRKAYTAKIFFTNPSTRKPKFAYNFPVDFGFVKTDVEDTDTYTTIMFSPTRAGKYKFFVEALCDSPSQSFGVASNILLGYRTMHVEVIDPEVVKLPKPKTPTVRAVDMKDWTN